MYKHCIYLDLIQEFWEERTAWEYVTVPLSCPLNLENSFSTQSCATMFLQPTSMGVNSQIFGSAPNDQRYWCGASMMVVTKSRFLLTGPSWCAGFHLQADF